MNLVALRWGLTAASILALIIAPWVVWGEPLTVWAEQLILGGRNREIVAAAVAALLAADMLIPLPSSFVAVAAGMVLGTPLASVVGTLGLTAGCVAGYALGRFVGRHGVARFASDDELRRVDGFADTYGAAVVVMLRAVPVLAEASVIFAGLSRVPFVRFLLLCTTANALISLVYAAVGDVAAQTDTHFLGILGACAVPLAAIIVARRLATRAKQLPPREAG